MDKTCVIYGSSTGTCQAIAEKIACKLGVAGTDVYDVAGISAETVGAYKNLLLGTSTWGAGELQDDWYDGLEKLKGADLSGKTIALFGCGDCESYGDTFCGALAEIYEGLKGSGAKFEGRFRSTDIPSETLLQLSMECSWDLRSTTSTKTTRPTGASMRGSRK